MTIVIITMHRPQNPGCQLQAYGLQETVRRLGCDCEIIDYRYPNFVHGQGSLKKTLGRMALKPIKRILGRGDFERAERRFSNFIRRDLNLSERPYFSPAALRRAPPDYDLYMVGSDQVWNPNFTKGDPAFFCDFAPEDRPVVSYASSFGVSRIPDEYREVYRRHLLRFGEIGVREKSGVEIVRELTGREAHHVLDPTLLLTAKEWEERIPFPKTERKPYILCYGNPTPNVANESLARQIQKKMGLRIVHLYGRPWQRFNRGIEYVFDAGPWEFIDWIRGASFVVTNSFHGTLFSINFERPFFSVYKNPESGGRQLGILEQLGLEGRAVLAGAEPLDGDPLELPFGLVRGKLVAAVLASHGYLRKAVALTGEA